MPRLKVLNKMVLYLYPEEAKCLDYLKYRTKKTKSQLIRELLNSPETLTDLVHKTIVDFTR